MTRLNIPRAVLRDRALRSAALRRIVIARAGVAIVAAPGVGHRWPWPAQHTATGTSQHSAHARPVDSTVEPAPFPPVGAPSPSGPTAGPSLGGQVPMPSPTR